MLLFHFQEKRSIFIMSPHTILVLLWYIPHCINIITFIYGLQVEEDLLENAISCLKNAGFTFSNEESLLIGSKPNGAGSRNSGNLSGTIHLNLSTGSNKSTSSRRSDQCSMVITKLPYHLGIKGIGLLYECI